MLSIRPFQPSAHAYDDLTDLWNALHPEWPRHATVWKRVDDKAPAGGFRLLADEGGRPVGGVDVRPGEYGRYDISLFGRPQAGGATVLEPLYDAMRERLPDGRVELRAYVADSRPWLTRFFEGRGFTSVQQTAYSRLDVDTFEIVPHEQRAADVLRQGYQVASLLDLSTRDEDWKRKYWRLTCDLLREVPSEGGFVEPSFEAFEKTLTNTDHYNLAASFVVLDEGVLVAGSRLKTFVEIPTFSFVDLTGTLRSHRRKGLATLAKLATIAYARQHGHRWMVTLNDVTNPMLQLNRGLGFRLDHIQHTLAGS